MKKTFIALLVILATLVSCVDEQEHENTPQGNFEALWQIIDEHYCFFDYKDVDWNAIYNIYKVRASDNINREQLFEVLTDMLSELRDGHVNLATAFDYGRYWRWHEDYPSNFSDTLQRRYLGTDYRIAGGLKYKILDDNIGYVYYGSFNSAVGESNLDEVIYHLMFCQGMILDIRGNGGGNLTYAEKLAARFCNEKTLVCKLSNIEAYASTSGSTGFIPSLSSSSSALRISLPRSRRIAAISSSAISRTPVVVADELGACTPTSASPW